MKVLHLMRHAKSSWQASDLADHERELNERGRRDAPRMGQALAEIFTPVPIHCSTAVRARQTLEGLGVGSSLIKSQPHEYEDALYTFDYEDLLAWLQGFPGQTESCFVLGHNPALTDLCNHLVGRLIIDNLPTAGYLQLDVPVDSWSDLCPGIATLTEWRFPRDLA